MPLGKVVRSSSFDVSLCLIANTSVKKTPFCQEELNRAFAVEEGGYTSYMYLSDPIRRS